MSNEIIAIIVGVLVVGGVIAFLMNKKSKDKKTEQAEKQLKARKVPFPPRLEKHPAYPPYVAWQDKFGRPTSVAKGDCEPCDVSDALLAAVHKRVMNSTTYVKEAEGATDYHQGPEETEGDCDLFSIKFMDMAIMMGVPRQSVRIAHAIPTGAGWHSFCIVNQNGSAITLDQRKAMPWPLEGYTELVYDSGQYWSYCG